MVVKKLEKDISIENDNRLTMTHKFKVQVYNKISSKGLSLFDKNKYDVSTEHKEPDAILLRSYKLQDIDLPQSVKVIARAGAGVNNVPQPYSSDKGIVVFNTPGANANAVKELVLCAMFLCSRDILGAANHVLNLEEVISKDIEKVKSQFKGSEIFGKNVLVVGLGAIGISVANALNALGMTVYGYDPFISVKSAWGLSREVKLIDSLSSVLSQVEYVSVHMPLTDKTKGFINSNLLNTLSKSVSILNFSRSEIVEHNDILNALKSNSIHKYVTDFPHKDFQRLSNVISLPHLGASTIEAEDNCAVMAVEQLIAYLEEGRIKNSVNFPNLQSRLQAKYRVEIKHKNIPSMVQKISSHFGNAGINILEMMNKSRDELAVTLIDVDTDPQKLLEKLNDSYILSVRIIENR